MSLFGLDLTQKGLSLYAIPAAFASAMSAHGYAAAAAGKLYDPANPRRLQATIESDDKVDKIVSVCGRALSEHLKNRILRARSAAQNAWETLGMFSAGVAAANAAGVDPYYVNLLSFGYIGSRILYNIIYIRLQDNRAWAPARSLTWISGLALTFSLYLAAASKFAAS
nr:uncharacterized protein CTRU02_11709 [Colletotrichum truncatum]KAF6785409.1 hypothetical protein CTRU02_11709 [Colletotrichum truncatum]